MKVVHITGRAGSGKSRLIFQQIKEHLDSGDDRKLILLVPEQFTLQSERDLIQYLQLPGIMQVEVLSFNRLAERILDEAGGNTRVMIDDQGRHMVLRKIIDELTPQLTVYQKVSRQDGFVRYIGTFLSELKHYNITSDMLHSAGESQAGTLRDKLHDIALIYQHFNDFLGTRYLDIDDRFNLVLERINASTVLNNSLVWLDGFTVFTPQQLSIIHKLMQICAQLTCAYTLDDSPGCRDRELFEPSRRAYDAIKRLAQELNLPQEYIFLKDDSSNRNEVLIHLEREIYAYPHRPYSQEISGLRVFAATNVYQEVEQAAAQIVCLVREKEMRWRDVMVICSDMDRYGHIISRTFQEYGIPFFADIKRNIMIHPLVEYILALLDMVLKNFRPLDVFRYLKTGLTDVQMDEAEILENYAITYGIKGEQWKEEFQLGKDQPLEALNRYRRMFIDPVAEMEQNLRQASTIGEYTACLYNYLQQQDIFARLENWIKELKEQGKYEQVYEHTQIWNIVMRIFDQTVDIMGDQPATLSDYRRILESGFASYQLGLIPTTVDQVLVGTIDHIKSRGVKALVILGMNDGLIPSALSEDGLLLEEERSQLIDSGLELPGGRKQRLEEERLMIYSLLGKPSQELWISYALADGEGKSLRPSVLIDRLTRIFPELQVQSDVIQDRQQQLSLIGPPISTLKHLIHNIRQYLDGKPIEDFWWQVLNWYQSQPDWQPVMNMIRQALFHSNAVPQLAQERVQNIYGRPFRSSVSRLEQFAACPFAHLVRYGLRPRERREYTVAIPDIGELMHQCLYSFAQEVARQGLDWSSLDGSQCDSLVNSIMDNLVTEYGEGVFVSSHRYRYAAERLKRMGRTTVKAVVEHVQKGHFRPAAFEVRFGTGGPFPPITVELADGSKVLLEGRVDRIDLLDDGQSSYIKVIDYKTGRENLRLDDVYYGLSLQLLVYLQAVLQQADHWGLKNAKPAGVFYFHIQDPLVTMDNMIVEKVEQELRKKFRMKGLVLKDARIIQSMDCDIQGSSQVVPAAINADGSVRESSAAIAEEDWAILLQHVDQTVARLAQEIIQGCAAIEPFRRDKDSACTYCPYHSICQFDPLFEGNQYRYLPNFNHGQVMELIRGEVN